MSIDQTQHETKVLDDTLIAVQKKKEILQDEKQYYLDKGLKSRAEFWDSITDMDDVEKALNKTIFDQTVDDYMVVFRMLRSLDKMLDSPYYGKIRIKEDGKEQELYIGLTGFNDPPAPFILDWRAPISSLFYDYEVGPAQYTVEDTTNDVELLSKNQIKIEKGKLQYIINSSLKIDDEILQEALSHNTSEKMRNVVATIQKEQNNIIRLPYKTNVIVQGVAGSGKTSIALHRIAFLLYRQRNVLNSRNIQILSPNTVFEDYISNVLPEMGEENIKSINFDRIINDYYYERKQKVENKAEQYERILKLRKLTPDISYKNSIQIISDLETFLQGNIFKYLHFSDFVKENFVMEKESIIEVFKQYYNLPLWQIKNKIKGQLAVKSALWDFEYNEHKTNIAIERYLRYLTPKNLNYILYTDFLKEHGFTFTKYNGKIKYEDAFPIMLIDDYLEGLSSFTSIQHLVVDEMQDYSPMQFRVLNILYPCSKTILGDYGQSMCPKESKQAIEQLHSLFDNSMYLTINRCYRTSEEIGDLCNTIGGREDVVMVRKGGNKPKVIKVKDDSEFIDRLKEILNEVADREYKNIAIITKDQDECDYYVEILKNANIQVETITAKSVTLPNGLIVVPSFQSKGLEFDCVIIPNAGENNYSSEFEYQNLYISASRSLHHLFVLYKGQPCVPLQKYLDKHNN
ncbi:MAG TPA: hypothetical protein DD621_05250 [Clostridiales bacterium]|nr:hypothetical protein [Clostridiales bacterium]